MMLIIVLLVINLFLQDIVDLAELWAAEDQKGTMEIQASNFILLYIIASLYNKDVS